MEFGLIPEGKFRIICSRMTLARVGALPLKFSGAGEIRQNENGRFFAEFALSKKRDMPAAMAETHRPKGGGHPIPKDEYMELTAKDERGVTWRGKVPRMSVFGDLLRRPKIHATVVLLETESPSIVTGDTDTARCVILGQLNYPFLNATESVRRRKGVEISGSTKADHTEFNVGSDTFVLSFEGENTVLECTFPRGGVAACHHVRMVEALQFALGQLVRPFVWTLDSAGSSRTLIWSPRAKRPPSSLVPPFNWNSDFLSKIPFEIAAAYYNAIKAKGGDDWHPLTEIVFKTVDAGASSTDMREISFAIATESAAELCYSSAGLPPDAFKEEVGRVIRSIKKRNLPHAGPRIEGSLDALLRPRNSDRIKAFIKDKALPKDLFTIWQKMRNTVTHGRSSSDDFETRWEKLFGVLFLFHSIVLHHIRYVGPRTDYVSKSQPTIPWPHVQSEPTPASLPGIATRTIQPDNSPLP